MEFDKSRVFTAVNADELRAGDKVIVANHLSVLKKRVQEGKEDSAIALHEINGEDWACRFGFITSDYALAYLVERKENCTNCGEGKWDAEHKKILCDPVNCGNGNVVFRNHEIEVCEYWKPQNKTEQKTRKHTDYNHCEEAKKAYVCAMTNACPNKHYRPFKDTDELVKVWEDKLHIAYMRTPFELPLIWVRNKRNKKPWLINEFDQGILDYLFTNCEFLDGSPCGVEE